MAKEIRKKKASFGTVAVDHLRHASPESEIPEIVHLVLSFEDALKLHLGIGQCLAKLNGYNRSTKAGQAAAIDLCLTYYKPPATSRLTVYETAVRKA